MIPDRLVKGIHEVLPGYEPLGITKLVGDLSNRQYFRFATSDHPKLIAMYLPENSLVSEEGGNREAEKKATLPFIDIQKVLYEKSVRVPHIYGFSPTSGVLVLEDFGGILLSEAAKAADEVQLQKLYEAALDQLENLAFGVAPSVHQSVVSTRLFDEKLFQWEFMHFVEYALDKRLKHPLTNSHRDEIVEQFSNLSKLMNGYPKIFTHRDYHSRNLMVLNNKEPELGVIDFQDALMAPLFYDLASLLRDSYILLPDSLRQNLVLRYRDQVIDHEPQLGLVPDEFMWQFDLIGTHRNLKAAGRFFFADEVKNMPHYIPDVPRTLTYVRNTLSKYEELVGLWKLLDAPLQELIELASKE